MLNPFQVLSQGVNKMSQQKLVNASAERNKGPILEMIKKYFKTDKPGNVLEISSGTGQHVAYFAPHFPNLTFQPSEYDKSMLKQIQLYINSCPTTNIKSPLNIDIRTPIETWGLDVNEYDYIININMIHVSPFHCTECLFKNAAILLKEDGLLITYGAYAMNGVLEPKSNVDFDHFIRSQNPEWGIRDLIFTLKKEAEKNGIQLVSFTDMPANNKCVIWKKL